MGATPYVLCFLELAAGVCNHTNLLVLPFSFELVRPAA